MSPIPKPILDPRLNYGNVVQIVLLLVMIVGGFVYVVRWQGDVDSRLAYVERYAPIVEALVKSDTIQNERMSNLADIVIDVRKSQTTITDKLGIIATSVAVIEERTKKVPIN